MALPKALQRFADLIDEISDERGSGYGYCVYLKAGWKSGMDPLGCEHQIHEDTITECARELRYVMPCDCRECRQIQVQVEVQQ